MIPPDHPSDRDLSVLLAAIEGQLHALRVSVAENGAQLRLLTTTQRTILATLTRVAGKPPPDAAA